MKIDKQEKLDTKFEEIPIGSKFYHDGDPWIKISERLGFDTVVNLMKNLESDAVVVSEAEMASAESKPFSEIQVGAVFYSSRWWFLKTHQGADYNAVNLVTNRLAVFIDSHEVSPAVEATLKLTVVGEDDG